MSDALQALTDLFVNEASQEYLGERVSVAAHMLQAGALAEEAGAPDALVAAALLHDVGHAHELTRARAAVGAVDARHEESGADWLAQWFAEDITQPVRLHVAAKRYLCRVDDGYLGQLSPASVRSLALQGGPMTPEEARAFEQAPYATAAVAVRRWDEAAKDPERETPPFVHFLPLLTRLATPWRRLFTHS